MTTEAYRDQLKLLLTGYVTEIEVDDTTIDKILESSLIEIQRYIDITTIETIPYSRCIDLSPRKINAVTSVYRPSRVSSSNSSSLDPMQIAQWQILVGPGSMYNVQNYFDNFMAYSTMQQIRNTLSTDLDYIYDRKSNKLYISIANDVPSRITVEYIPRFDSVEEIYSDYWIDVIMQMSLAKLKIVLGRIRSKFRQSNALWETDGDTLLNEGNTELSELRNKLQSSTQLSYPID